MMKLLPVFAVLMLLGSAISGQTQDLKPGNIAPQATPSASSSRPEYPVAGVNDNRWDTQWSTAQGQIAGQWLQLDWDAAQEICGVVLHATGPWTQAIDIQVSLEGTWTSVGRSGSAEEKAPIHAIVSFKPVRTKSVRFVFDGGAAYHEIEVYNDAKLMAQAVAEYTKASIFVAGDLRGHLMGTVSQDSGAVVVPDAEVTVTGSTPNGAWKETAKTGKNGDFEAPLPFAATGSIKVTVAKGEFKVEQSFNSRDISRN